MAKIKLQDEEWQKPEPRFLVRSGGKGKVFGVIGISESTTPTGAKVIELQCLVLKDLDPDGDPRKMNPVNDEGLETRFKLWCTDAGRYRGIVPLLRAQGWPSDQEFDEDSFDDLSELVKKPFIGCVEHSTSNGRTYSNVDGRTIRRFEGEIDPTWKDKRNAAADAFETRQEQRAERRARSGGGGGGGAGGRYSADPDVGF